MDPRLSFSLLSVIVLAVVVGVLAAQSQHGTVAAPVPTALPTPLPLPVPGHVDIVASNSSNPPARYDPPLLRVHAGQTVTWVNLSSVDQTVTSDDGTTINSPALGPGQLFRWRAAKAGTIGYSSLYYPAMHGTIEVVP